MKLWFSAPSAGIAEIAKCNQVHDTQRCWWDLNPIRLTVAKSVDYNMVPQHLQMSQKVGKVAFFAPKAGIAEIEQT